MSSLTMAIRMNRSPVRPPTLSMATAGVPGWRAASTPRVKVAASAMRAAVTAARSSGSNDSAKVAASCLAKAPPDGGVALRRNLGAGTAASAIDNDPRLGCGRRALII